MKIPGLGHCEQDDDEDIFYSDIKTIKGLNAECEFIVEGYVEDTMKEDFHQAIKHFIALKKLQLKDAEPHLLAYYQDTVAHHPAPGDIPTITQAADVWSHIDFGFEVTVRRRADGDRAVYLSFECNCDWEPEHGLQLVFKNGNVIAKLGPFDGHLTNADAYGDPALEDVVYRRRH